MADKLFNTYYYSDTNIYSNNNLWKQIQKDESYKKTMTRKNFNDWLKDQEQEQIAKVKYKPDLRLTHPILAKPFTYQTDLMFLHDLHKLNDGYDSIINFIEVTTRKAFSYPLRSKTSSEVYEAFQEFFIDIEGKIDNLELDKGTEFQQVIKFCKKMEIHMSIYNNDKNSMSMVERFNRTLRGFISKTCKNGVWYKKLSKLVDAYNNKEHSSTDYTPNTLSNNPKLQKVIREEIIGKSIEPYLELHKFNIGDTVRFYKKRKLFGKGGGQYSESLHKITDIRKNSIFLDDDNNKKYRYYNLIKVGKISKPINISDNIIRDNAKREYKTALKLAKEQPVKLSVKKVEENLKQILNDNLGKGLRIKKANKKYL